MHFTDQAITNLRTVVIGQQHFGGQGKKRCEDVGQIAGVEQLHARIAQPLALIDQLQHQQEKRAVENVDIEFFKPGAFQQNRRQIAEAGAVNVQLWLVEREAGGLQSGLVQTIMTAGELDATHTQRRVPPLDQANLDGQAIFRFQSRIQRRPAPLDNLSIVFKAFAHATSHSLQAKKRSRLTLERFFVPAFLLKDFHSRAIDDRRTP
ncbi:hypothetical protein D3C81_1212160 [compost metagenome]